MDSGKIYYSDGSIDWETNGWPEPNAAGETVDDEGRTVDDMPDDIFEIWLEECYSLDELGVE